MKYLILTASFLLLGASAVLFAADDMPPREGYGATPTDILDNVVGKANEYNIIDTQRDGVTSKGPERYHDNPEYTITNTLFYVKNRIHPYLQRTLYIGLAAATILLIYNGFLLVTNAAHGEGELTKIKANLMYIGIGVIILTGFYFLLDLIVAVINFLFGV